MARLPILDHPSYIPLHASGDKAKAPSARLLHEHTGEWRVADALEHHADIMREPWTDATTAWGMILWRGVVALDFDIDKADPSRTGWTITQERVGVYGSEDFPRTFLTRTPSGGTHAFYRVPRGVRLLDGVHAPDPDWQGDGPAPTIPLDIRASGRGYVVAAGSRTAAGEYVPVDMPADGRMPMLTDAMGGWLVRLGMVEGAGPKAHRTAPPMPRLFATGGGSPDMTPIPEGSRNDTLYRWGFGRHQHYPADCARIDADILQRASVSQLPEHEARAIIDSIHRTIGGSK